MAQYFLPGFYVKYVINQPDKTCYRPTGQYRYQELRVELDEPTRVAGGPVLKVGHVLRGDGPLIAALAAEANGARRLLMIAGEERSNFLTGKSELTFADPVELPFEDPGGEPLYVGVNGTGSDVVVSFYNGGFLRVGDVLREPYVAERGRLVAEGRELTAMRFREISSI